MSIESLKTNWKSIISYCTIYFIPSILLFFMNTFYNMGFGHVVPSSLTTGTLFMGGLSACSMLFYARHSNSFQLSSKTFQYLVAISYSLSSYILVQEGLTTILFIYAIFPIYFYVFEAYINNKYHMLFIVLTALILSVYPSIGMPIIFIMFLLAIFEYILSRTLTPSRVINLILCNICSLGLAAFRIIPYYIEQVKNGYEYPGFLSSYSPIMFFSRFLVTSTDSASFFDTYGLDLYFGMFLLFEAILFFFNASINPLKKIYYFVFTLLLGLMISCSPFFALFNFLQSPYTSTVPFSFIMIFWCIRLACINLTDITATKKKSLILTFLLLLLIYTLIFICYIQNFHKIATLSILFFSVISYCTVCFIHLLKKPDILYKYVLLFATVELTCNLFVVTNQDFIPLTRTLEYNEKVQNFVDMMLEKPAYNTHTGESSDSSAEVISDVNIPLETDISPDINIDAASSTDKLYSDFLKSHSNSELQQQLNSLFIQAELSEDDYEKYCGKVAPNFFEQANVAFKKLGQNSDLFSKVDVILCFEDSENYTITPIGNNMFTIHGLKEETKHEIIPFTIDFQHPDTISDFYLTDTISSTLLKIKADEVTGKKALYYAFDTYNAWYINVEFETYVLNKNAYASLADTLEIAKQKKTQSLLHTSDYLSLIISCVFFAFFLLLIFNPDKEAFYQSVDTFYEKINRHKLFQIIKHHLVSNWVYYLSFLIPFGIYITCMIIYSCAPFGANTIFDEDGTGLTLPVLFDLSNVFSSRNMNLSMNAGFGNNYYAGAPTLPLLYYYRYIPVTHVAAFISIIEGICIGFSGFFMSYYLTHRLKNPAAQKNDYRVLIPALIYSCNNFVLGVHSFIFWFYPIMLLPLLLLAMDRLLIQKKKTLYIIVLTICIYYELYLSLYICIFLVLFFFTYQFDDIKDFIQKGIRFALCSILSASNGILVIGNVLLSTNDSAYRDADSVSPHFGFFANFFDQWRQYMIFSGTGAVTSASEHINIYCGILTIMVVLIYLLYAKQNITKKCINLAILVLLTLTFNEQVLSYIWNGLHFQSNVPNRHVFTFLFFVAELSYDGIRHLHKLHKKQGLIIFICIFSLISMVQFGGVGNSKYAYVSSLILATIYFVFFLLINIRTHRKVIYGLLSLVMTIELFANASYSFSNYGLTNYSFYGDILSTRNFIHERLTPDTNYVRIGYPSYQIINAGRIYNTGAIGLFNSYVTKHQLSSAKTLSFIAGGNYICETTTGTPFNRSLAGTKYLFIPSIADRIPSDLEHYKYIGHNNNFYIYENENALSLGFYYPTGLLDDTEFSSYIPDASNQFVNAYTGKNDILFNSIYLSYDETGSLPDSFNYTDEFGNILTYEQAHEKYVTNSNNELVACMNDLNISIRFTATSSGTAYFYPNEYIALSKVEKGDYIETKVAYPNSSTEFRDGFNIAILDENVLKTFFDAISDKQVENVQINNDTITCTTDYKEDGYTTFTLAYDLGWNAYIDGKEVEILDPYENFIFIRTPAGKHTIELKFKPYGAMKCVLISAIFWIISLLVIIYESTHKRRLSQN